ncbi:MAG: metallophosphoesterase family protein [Ardenticatenaceae bacterium]|nr:metallophosphoesterase family protein [Ardenticatenaceae bacterium]
MRVAIFSDVHGNLTALEAVLAAIEQQAVDTVVFAGDLCVAGPHPAECLQRVRQMGIPAVYGNTDHWLLGITEPPERVQAMCEWTLAQLNEEQRDWLRSLPLSYRLSPTNTASDDLLIVHANPKDAYGLIFPAEAEQMARYGRLRQPDADLDEWLSGTEAAVVAYGHLHIPGIRHWRNLTLANISSVNMPGDGDARAKYGLLVWQNGRWHIEHHQVAYDIQPEIAAIKQAQPPGWEGFVQTLEELGFFPQNV